MWSKCLGSTACRLLLVAAGLSLIVYGGLHRSLTGLVLMMAGVVPAITGLARICLRDEVSRSHPSGEETGRPRERRA